MNPSSFSLIKLNFLKPYLWTFQINDQGSCKKVIEGLVERFSEHSGEYHLPDYNEAKTRQDFINPFFKALGWDIDNEKGDSEAYREVIYEDKVMFSGKAKAPDYGFRLAGIRKKLLKELDATGAELPPAEPPPA